MVWLVKSANSHREEDDEYFGPVTDLPARKSTSSQRYWTEGGPGNDVRLN